MQLAILKCPRWLVLFAFLVLWAGSYYIAVGLDHLQAHDPQKQPPNMFDGSFDGVIICFLIPGMLIGAVGSTLSALWCICRLITEIICYVRSKHAAQPAAGAVDAGSYSRRFQTCQVAGRRWFSFFRKGVSELDDLPAGLF